MFKEGTAMPSGNAGLPNPAGFHSPASPPVSFLQHAMAQPLAADPMAISRIAAIGARITGKFGCVRRGGFHSLKLGAAAHLFPAFELRLCRRKQRKCLHQGYRATVVHPVRRIREATTISATVASVMAELKQKGSEKGRNTVCKGRV